MRRFIFICLCIIFAVLMTRRFYLRDNVLESLKNDRGSVFLYFPDAARSAVKVLSAEGIALEKGCRTVRPKIQNACCLRLIRNCFFKRPKSVFSPLRPVRRKLCLWGLCPKN